MRTWASFALAFIAALVLGAQVLSACGDKFLLVGRGVRFQKAYAAIHPASVLIVLPPQSVKSAAVRDSRLVDALKMAGHRVTVVKQPANLADVLNRHDIVLASRADVLAFPPVAQQPDRAQPSIVAVLEEPSASELAAARTQLEYVLKTPQPLTQILNLLDDIMKARKENVRRPVAGA